MLREDLYAVLLEAENLSEFDLKDVDWSVPAELRELVADSQVCQLFELLL